MFPQAPPAVVRVTVSVPVRLAWYVTDPLVVPEDGFIEFASDERRSQDDTALTNTDNVAVLPDVTDDGPESDAVAPVVRVTSARVSSLVPHAVVA